MRIVKQDLQDDFKCIADKCPCTCCSGWQIVVDEASLKRYESYQGKLEERFKKSIDFDESAIYQQDNGDCAFLNRNGLCDMITAEGDGILCDTCRLYPRHQEEFEDLREWSMSLSCPEVARMLVELGREVEYKIEDNDEEDPLEDDFEDFDLILFDKLVLAREMIFKIIRNKKFTLSQKMGIILDLAERLQVLFDEGEVFMMDEVISEYEDNEYLEESAEENELVFSEYIKEDAKVLNELERLSDDWEEILSLLKHHPGREGDTETDYIEGTSLSDKALILQNIFEALIFTYFLGSIYNGMIYAYTHMCMFMVIMLDAFSLSLAKKTGKKITKNDFEQILYRFLRETEHSDVNINHLLEYFDL